MSLTNTGNPTYVMPFQSTTTDTVSGLAGSISTPTGFTNLRGAAALVNFGSNTCVQFTGASGTYTTMTTGVQTNYGTLTSNLFVEAWIYPSSFTANTIAASTGSTFQNWWFGLDNTGKVTATVSGQSAKAASSLTLSTWNHVAFSWTTAATSNSIYVFTNGVAAAPVSFTGVPVSTLIGEAFLLGANTATTLNFSGYIQDVRMVNNGRTPQAIVPIASFTPVIGPFPFNSAASPYFPGASIISSGEAVTLQQQFQPLSYTSGVFGQALKVLSLNNGVQYAVSLNSTTGFTIACWLNPSGSQAQIVQAALYLSSTNLSSFARIEFVAGTNTSTVNISVNGGTVSTGTTIYDGTWFHAAIVFRGDTLQSYINGSLAGTRVSSTQIGVIYTILQLGKPASGGVSTGPACFAADDLRIYNFAMNSTQVAGIYSTAPASILPAPTLMWPFQSSNLECNTGITPLYSTLTTSTQAAPTYITGKYGRAISFVNTVAYGSPLSNSYSVYNINPNVGLTANNLTVAFWYQPLGVGNSGNQSIFQVLDSVAGSVYIYIQDQSTYSGIQNIAGIAGTLIPPNTWAHVAIVTSNVGADTNNVFCSYYLNGSSQGTSNITLSSTSGTISSCWLASQYYSGTNGTHPAWCSIQDLRFYNSVLTSNQISSIYNATQPANLITTSAAQVIGQSVSPSLLWSFETSNVDSITGLAPSQMVGTPTYTQGKYGQAIQFVNTPPTSSQALYYTIPSSVGSMVNGLTVCFWLNPQSIPNPQNQTYVFIDGPVSGSTGAYFMFMDNGTATAPTLYGQNPTGSGYYPGIGTGTLPQGSWTHMTGVWTPYTGSSNTMTLYVNGVFNSSVYYANAFTINRLTLATNAGSRGSPCIIDDLRIYNTVLTSSQIQSIYNQAAVPVTSIGFYKS